MDVEFIKKELQQYLGCKESGSFDRFLEHNGIGERSYVRLEDGITLGIENILGYKGNSKIVYLAVIRDSYCLQCGVTAVDGDADFCIACAV
jgi:hypothetical protein